MAPIVTINSLHQLKQTLGLIAANTNYTNIAISIDETDLETMKISSSGSTTTTTTLQWLQDTEVAKLWGEVKEKVVVLVEGREFSNQEIKQLKRLGVVGSFVCEDVLRARDLKKEFQDRTNKVIEATKTS